MRLISLLGIKYVELFANIFHLDPRLGKADTKKISSLLGEYDLIPLSMHAPFAKIDGGGSISKTKKLWEDLMNETFHLVEALKVPSIVIHPQALMISAGGNLQPIDLTDLLIDGVIPYANKHGIKVLIENLHPITFNAYFTIAELDNLLNSINDMSTGICLDTCHCISSGIDPVAEIETNTGNIEQIHLSDDLYEPKCHRHLPLGAGCIDWPSFFSTLNQKRFRGSLILEIDAGNQPFDTVKNSMIILDQCLTNFRYED